MDREQDRRDDLDRFYQPIDQFDGLTTVIYWVSVSLSIILLYPQLLPGISQEIASVAFAAIVVIHFLLSQYLRLHLIPRAESRRRKVLISNAFDVALIGEETKLYYNNPFPPSLRRLGANVFENSFFAKAVCEEMARRERIKVVAYFSVYLVAALFRSTDLALLTILTQIVFSSEVIAKWINIETLRRRNEQIFDEMYRTFLRASSEGGRVEAASILDAIVAYESAKANAGVKQSTRIFHKLNPQLTREWNAIKQKLGIESHLIAENPTSDEPE